MAPRRPIRPAEPPDAVPETREYWSESAEPCPECGRPKKEHTFALKEFPWLPEGIIALVVVCPGKEKSE